jgi:polyisoprenoid-binding protein YceI
MSNVSTAPALATWNVDPTHSGVEFSVKHFFTPVRGKFDTYEAELAFDPEQPSESRVSVRIDVTSINTGNEDRDAHLLSGDFFDAESYPWITFESDAVRVAGENELVVSGNLTIKDVTRRVELPVTMQGVKDLPAEMQEMFGGIEQVASFTTGTRIDRSDYGVGVGSWAAALVVGHDVNITISIEANR